MEDMAVLRINKTIEEINEENNISEKRVERPRSYRRRFSRRKY